MKNRVCNSLQIISIANQENHKNLIKNSWNDFFQNIFYFIRNKWLDTFQWNQRWLYFVGSNDLPEQNTKASKNIQNECTKD